MWRKEHPELLSGCLRPERNNEGEASRQKKQHLVSSEDVLVLGGWHGAPREDLHLLPAVISGSEQCPVLGNRHGQHCSGALSCLGQIPIFYGDLQALCQAKEDGVTWTTVIL